MADIRWSFHPIAPEPVAGKPLCETERHPAARRPYARWLELLSEIQGETIYVHRAWHACQGCHNGMAESYTGG